MTSAFSVRRAVFEDAATIAQLCLLLDPNLDPALFAQRFARLLERPTHAFFVLDDAGGVAGFAAAEHRSLLQFGDRIELIALVVDPRLRRKGAGGSLVAAVEAWAWRRGVEEMVVRSSVSRDASDPFYQRIGYVHHKTQHVYTRKLTP
jgi:N-acetylglutamate synthase-like GNAT family acetyltransferase